MWHDLCNLFLFLFFLFFFFFFQNFNFVKWLIAVNESTDMYIFHYKKNEEEDKNRKVDQTHRIARQ